MNEDAASRRAKEAADGVRQARPGWGASQERAKDYLDAKVHQLNELKEIQRTDGDGALRGTISSGIEAVERDVANIQAEIPTLKPGC
jgi:hypothetical protein